VLDGGCYGRLGILGTGDIQLDDEQVVRLAERIGHGGRAAARRDDGVARGQRSLHDVDAHAPAGTGNEPDLLVSHRTSGLLLSAKFGLATRGSRVRDRQASVSVGKAWTVPYPCSRLLK
jgi:hypothetical protein